jgi:hypothetical protein
MESLPMFKYNEPKGYVGGGSARTTQVRFYPQGLSNFGSGVGANQYVKFDFRTTGFWDPKSCYMQIEVELEAKQNNATIIAQVDNSAQSLFSQLIIRHNGVEIERNNEYDSLCAMLYDMNVGLGARDYQDLQGMGKNRHGYYPGYQSRGTNTLSTTREIDTPNIISLGTGYTNTVGTHQTSPQFVSWRPYTTTQVYGGNGTLVGTAGSQAFHQCTSFCDIFPFDSVEGLQQEIATPDFQIQYGWDGIISTQVRDTGYTFPYSEACVGTGEPWMTDGEIGRYTIASGQGVMKTPKILNFVLPIMSPIWGANATHGKLLPMALFQGLEFEFQISPYAFAMHKTNDTKVRSSNSWNGPTNLYTRTDTITEQQGSRTRFRIKNMAIICEMINLDEAREQTILNDIISGSGFNLSHEQWFLCQRVKFDGTQQLNTTLQINHAFESLKMLTLRAVPADFESFAWARKHQSISMNLTSMQLRIGNEYIPSTPITGHTGNIRTDTESPNPKANYVDFFIQTKKAWGKFFDMNDSTLLNPTNYTMNQTALDPSGMDPDLDLGIGTALATAVRAQPFFAGQSLFHNNRAVPRCIISLDTERFDIEPRVRSGLNTVENRPFDLILQNDTSGMTYNQGFIANNVVSGAPDKLTCSATNFTRHFYLYVWAYYDASLVYENGAWKCYGKH